MNIGSDFCLDVQIAPKGLNDVQTMACGACSNENAFKVAFFHYMVIITFIVVLNVTRVDRE